MNSESGPLTSLMEIQTKSAASTANSLSLLRDLVGSGILLDGALCKVFSSSRLMPSRSDITGLASSLS